MGQNEEKKERKEERKERKKDRKKDHLSYFAFLYKIPAKEVGALA